MSLLKTITPANGYASDLSDFTDGAGNPATRIFRGRSVFGDNDPLPMISFLQPPAPVDPRESPIGEEITESHWLLMIQGFVKDDPLNPTDPAEILMADVRKCLAVERERGKSARRTDFFGLGTQSTIANGAGSVTDFTIGTGLARPSDHVSAKAYFWLLLTIQLVENVSLPYGK